MVKNNPFNVALLLTNVSIFVILFRLIKNKGISINVSNHNTKKTFVNDDVIHCRCSICQR
jgi:hypothetical protein